MSFVGRWNWKGTNPDGAELPTELELKENFLKEHERLERNEKQIFAKIDKTEAFAGNHAQNLNNKKVCF